MRLFVIILLLGLSFGQVATVSPATAGVCDPNLQRC